VPLKALTRVLGALAVVMLGTLASPVIPAASAEPCPDIETVFARGTFEEPGVGKIGQDFVDALRSQVGGRSVGVYAVNYPASTDFATGVDGIRDATAHIQSMAASCPKTKMVLGGYSQGAAVMGFTTADAVPAGINAAAVPAPMPAKMANHVAAVALFGKPSPQFMQTVGQPPVAIGPLYAAKLIELCTPNDPVCSDGGEWAAHGQYMDDGMVNQAATFVASKL
jgi:hypothetical protein